MIFSKVLMSDRNFPQFLEISMTKNTLLRDCALVQPKTVTLFIATVLVAVKMEINPNCHIYFHR